MRHFILSFLFAILLSQPVLADPPEIVSVGVDGTGSTRSFSVTIRHADTGWDHYADGWEVLGPDGSRLGFRELLHPHVNEQPFTRSLSGVAIPDGVTEVTIRAHCSVTGWSSDTVTVQLD